MKQPPTPEGASIGAPAIAPAQDLPVSSAGNAGPLVPPSTRRPESAAGCQRLPRPCPSSSSKRPRVGPAPAPPHPGGRCALSVVLTGAGTGPRSAATPPSPPRRSHLQQRTRPPSSAACWAPRRAPGASSRRPAPAGSAARKTG